MKPIHFFFLAIFLVGMLPGYTLKSQIVLGKPDTFMHPDHDIYPLGGLDSVVQYAYPNIQDSNRLHKWEYTFQPDEGIIVSYMFIWAPETRGYNLYHRYESGYNSRGQKTLTAHYFYNWQLERWRGCSSDGCGKKEWQYDEMGNETMMGQYYWNQGRKYWEISNKSENEFDVYGNHTLSAYFSFDQNSQSLIGNSKSEYSYYPDQRLWGEIYYYWFAGFNDWRAATRIINDYPDDTTTMLTYFDWQYPELEWVESSNGRIIKVLDSINNVEEELIFDWDENMQDWIPYTRVQNHMNESGETVLYYKYYWNRNDSVWRNYNKKEKGYDENGNLIMSVDYFWSSADSLWVGATNFFIGPGKTLYEYNQQGKLLLFTHYDWDRENMEWVGADDNQVELKYDDMGQVTEEIRYDWSAESAGWAPSHRLVIGYGPSGKVITESQYAWDEDLQEWDLILRYFFYRSGATAVRQVELSGINIYPNPNNGILNISGITGPARIQVFNLQGRQIKDILTDNDRVDLMELPVGLYFVRIQDGDRIHIQKMVKE